MLLSTGRRRRAGDPCLDRRFRRRARIDDRSGGSRRRAVRDDLETRPGPRLAAQLDPGLEADNPLDAWGTGQNFVATIQILPWRLDRGSERRDRAFQRRYPRRLLSASRLRRRGKGRRWPDAKPVAVVTNYTQVRHDALASNSSGPAFPCSMELRMRWPRFAARWPIATSWRRAMIRRPCIPIAAK